MSLTTHLFYAMKVSAKLQGISDKLSRDFQFFDQEYKKCYSSSYFFYHQVIRMPELEQTKEKLPYFPSSLMTYFTTSGFLAEYDHLRSQFDVQDYLNSLNSIEGISIPEPYSNKMARLVSLMDLHENENPYEPFLNYEGGRKVIKDANAAMPTIQKVKELARVQKPAPPVPERRRQVAERQQKKANGGAIMLEKSDLTDIMSAMDVADSEEQRMHTPPMYPTSSSRPSLNSQHSYHQPKQEQSQAYFQQQQKKAPARRAQSSN